MPFYGALCEPLLQQFATHRRHASDYFVGRNFGTVQVDWTNHLLSVDVHNHVGETVLTTGWRSWSWDPLTVEELDSVARTVDGHLVPTLVRWGTWVGVVFLLAVIGQRYLWSVLYDGGIKQDGAMRHVRNVANDEKPKRE